MSAVNEKQPKRNHIIYYNVHFNCSARHFITLHALPSKNSGEKLFGERFHRSFSAEISSVFKYRVLSLNSTLDENDICEYS